MTTVSHAAAGAVIGTLVQDPLLAFLGAVVAHAVMDIVPHYDLPDLRVDTALTIAAFVVLALLARGRAPVVWGMVGGILPDVENLLHDRRWMRRRLFPTHDGFLPHGRRLGPAHAVWQILIMAVALWRTAS